MRWSPTLGTYVEALPLIWQNLFFTNRLLIYAPGTPSLVEIANKAYASPEPFTATAELIGVIGHQRPSVVAGALDPSLGTVTRIMAHSEDRNITVDEERALYRYLTNDNGDQRLMILQRFDSVHDMLVSDPQAMIDAGLFSDL